MVSGHLNGKLEILSCRLARHPVGSAPLKIQYTERHQLRGVLSLPQLPVSIDLVWLQMRSIRLALLQLCLLQISLAAVRFKGAALMCSGMLAKMMLPKRKQQAKGKGRCQILID